MQSWIVTIFILYSSPKIKITVQEFTTTKKKSSLMSVLHYTTNVDYNV